MGRIMGPMNKRLTSAFVSLLALGCVTQTRPVFAASSFTNVDVVFKGAGWLKSGMIVHSTIP